MTKPKINLNDVKKAIDIGREALPLVMEFGPDAAKQISKKAKQAGQAIGGAKDSVIGKLKQHQETKEQQKAREEAQQRAVASSLPPVSATEFFKSFEANVSESDDLKTGYMAIPGCYAILTLKSAHEKDLSAYKDVYVGCGESIGFDVYSQLCGFGNVDVYADFKFKEPMTILVYPCDKDQLKDRFSALVSDLQAEESYNKWDILGSS